MLFCFKVHEAVIPSDLVQGRKVGGILYMYIDSHMCIILLTILHIMLSEM